jgi:filamentous hemagglutinin
MILYSKFLQLTKNFLVHFALVSLILEQFIFVSTASASPLPITPDGSTNTQVTQTASGIDQINIAAANSNGLSHNKFTDYNVNQAGQIINNFSGRDPSQIVAGNGATAVTQTQIGGLVTVNDNLANSGSARVILNEVTSGNVSKLLGYTEIAGSKADLILANPNGIACSGCGFINTARLLMVAGSSDFDVSGNLGFNLKEQANPNLYVPLITIDGLGLDVTRTNATDIIASSVKLLSSIYGSDNTALTIKTGEGRYDYSTKEIAGNNTQNNTDPVFAIDASSLAKIQSGQVYLIATKQGVGVKMEAEILASSIVNIDANGDVYYSKISAGDTANLKSTATIQSIDSNSSISAPNLKIQAGEFKNLGLASAENLTIQNSGTLNNFGRLEALNLNLSNITNINNSGLVYGENSLNISGVNLTNNSSGSIFSPQSYIITLSGLLTNSGLITSGNDLVVNSNQLHNNGEISSQNNLGFSIADLATNSGNLIAGSALNFSANSLINSGAFQSGNNTTFNLAALTNLENSTIYSATNLNLNISAFLTNYGEISSFGDLTITGTSSIDNFGKILSGGDLNIAGDNLTNNTTGIIAALTQSLTLTLSNNLQNDGELSSAINLNVSSRNFTNSGAVLSGNNLAVLATNSITNSSNLQSINDFSLNAASLDNSGLIKSFGKSIIALDSISNQADALIFSASDATILASNSLTNSGSILSNAKLDLTSGLTTNNNEIFSVGDLKLTLSNSLSNAGSISSLGKLDINSISSITNSNQILSSENLTIEATGLNNTSTIQSNSNLTLNLASLTNSNEIISGGTFNITASGNIANSDLLQSADSFTINAASFANSAASLILAGKDLTVRASSISNQNTKPSTSNITSGIVSIDGNVLLQADILNNNSGIIVGKSTTVNALNNSSVNLSNALGAFISTASITLDLGNIDYIITGTVTANNVDITANNITNQGNVTATDFIKLNATGTDGVSGSGNITNGFANGDNSNVQLAAGTYIDLTAKNNINNYGTILGTTDLTLSATFGSINNYSTGKITGGSGTTTVNALNGAFDNINQTSLFTANNNAIFNTKDLNNTGEISVANDLTTNITNNLTNNPTALIWSGHDATFNVAGTFLNNQADIYADHNLTIQKNTSTDASLNKTSLVQNISGNIETYGGDINIKANNLQNKRSYMPTQGGENEYRRSVWYAGHGWHTTVYYRAVMQGTAAPESNISSGNNLDLNISGNLLNDASSILTKNNATINAGSLSNNSYLFRDYVAVRHWDHNVHGSYGSHDSYDNDIGGFWYTGTKDGYVNQAYIYNANIKSGGNLTGNITSSINSTTIAGNIAVAGVAGQSRSTTINHVDVYTIEDTGIVDVDLSKIADAINGNSDAESASSTNINQSSSSGASLDTVFSGNFKINLDPSATTPLVESRSQFTDTSKFFGSEYYFNQLGLNGAAVLANIDQQTRNTTTTRILGDSFVETKLILDQIRTLTNDSFLLSKTTTDSNQQIKELLDNSIAEFARLGLSAQEVAINGLTKDQANLLNQDIITFETTKVNGINVLAPKIYLSLATRSRLLNTDSTTGGTALANGGTIFAKDSLTLDSSSANLMNSGSIRSDGNLTLNLASLTNRTNSLSQAQIISGNNLSITTNTGDIKNIGANIGSVGSLSLTTVHGNILNTAIVQTNDANLLNSSSDSYQLAFNDTARSSGNISSSLLENAAIRGGDISINAGGDFTNLAAKISTTKNTLADSSISSGALTIAAGDDINIGTLELRNRTEARWGSGKKGGISITDTTTNLSSNIEAAGNLTTNSAASTTIQGSNITASGNAAITTGADLNILSAQDTSYKYSASWKKGNSTFGANSKSSSSTSSTTTNVASNINIGGDLTLNATGTGLAKEQAAADITNIANQATYDSQLATYNTKLAKQQEAKDQLAAGNNSRFKNAQLKAIANETLTAPTLITQIASADINVVGSNLTAGTVTTSSNLNLTAQGQVNILSGQNTSYINSESSKKGSTVRKSSTDIDYKITNVTSNLETNGDVNIASGRDTNIIASNLTGANGNIVVGKYVDQNAGSPTFNQEIINNDAKLTIKSGEDYHYKLHQETKLEKDKGAMVVGAVAAVAAVALAPATGGGSLAYFAAAGGGALTGSQGQRGRTITNTQETTTQISSNLNFTNDLNTQSSGNTEITASNLKADNATILTGKFRDQSTNQETIINPDAQLKLNSAFNTQENNTVVKKVVPNYVGIAVVAGGAAYAGAYTEAKSGSWFLGQVASSDIKFGAQLIGGSLFNIRSKSSYSNYKETEIKTDLHFNNLTTQ